MWTFDPYLDQKPKRRRQSLATTERERERKKQVNCARADRRQRQQRRERKQCSHFCLFTNHQSAIINHCEVANRERREATSGKKEPKVSLNMTSLLICYVAPSSLYLSTCNQQTKLSEQTNVLSEQFYFD